MADKKWIRVRYKKSSIGYTQRQKDTVRALGLRKLGQSRLLISSDAVLGMCRAVSHLVEWSETDGPDAEPSVVAPTRGATTY